MNFFYCVVFILAWVYCGYKGVRYFFEYDPETLTDLIFCSFILVSGPFGMIVSGLFYIGEKGSKIVLIKEKRVQK